MTSPRPDQRIIHAGASAAGSRSGAGDFAGALGYPGIPSAAVNLQSAQALRRAAGGGGVFFTFPAPGRIWVSTLAYTVSSLSSFSGAPVPLAAFIQTVISGLPLAGVELSLSAPLQNEAGSSSPPGPGLPVVRGESLTLNINGGSPVPGVIQEASAFVLYSIP
jgi:hypothetical protein